MRAAAMILALLLVACVRTTPVVVPSTRPIPHVGLSGAYHAPLPPAMLATLNALGPITLRAAVQSYDQEKAIVNSLAPYPNLTLLVLVETADLALVRDLAENLGAPTWLLQQPTTFPTPILGIELGNELDLAGLTAQQFGSFVTQARDVLRDRRFRGDILSGGVYTVSDDTLRYLRDAHLPADVLIGLHWYGDSSDAWLAKAQAFGRPVAVTEFGLPSRTPAEDAQQTIYLREQRAAFTRLGARYALVYQTLSGPSQSDLDNFGVFRVDGSQKPAVSIFGAQ